MLSELRKKTWNRVVRSMLPKGLHITDEALQILQVDSEAHDVPQPE